MATEEYLIDNPHPGEFLREDFMKPLGLTAYRIAKDIGVPTTRIDQILAGKRGISADTALRFAAYFGTSASMWLGIQADYEMMQVKRSKNIDVKPYKSTAAA
jgi:addiction module HigA family antidote